MGSEGARQANRSTFRSRMLSDLVIGISVIVLVAVAGIRYRLEVVGHGAQFKAPMLLEQAAD